MTWEPLCLHTRGRPRRISRQKFPKRTRILSIPSKPYSFHSVHSAIGSRMNGMTFRSFRKRDSSQKNTNTVYSEYSYLTIILQNRAEYHLILSRRGRRPSWLNQGIFRKIEQDNCFIIQQIPITYHFQNEKNYGSLIKTLKASNT